MVYKVVVTESAENDLDAILNYICNELRNVTATIALADVIEEKYAVLAENPNVYEASRHELLKHRGYRRIVVKGYVMMYLVDDAEQIVYVARIFYGRQNYEKYL